VGRRVAVVSFSVSEDPARHRAKEKTALLPAPFRCTYAWNRPTSTGAGGSDPFWLCWRGRPWLAIRWRGYAASKWSQLERQLILGQRLSSIVTSQYRQRTGAANGAGLCFVHIDQKDRCASFHG
jgi:hypothetical protein